MAHVYLMKSDLKVGFSQGQLIVKEREEPKEQKIPFCNVDSINVFGAPQISTQLIRECLLSGVTVGYYTEDGHYCGRITPSNHADPLRQRKQILLTGNKEFCLSWAKLVVEAKIKNSLSFLASMEEIYDFTSDDIKGITHSLQYLKQADDIDVVFGLEGNAAREYFSCLSKLVIDPLFSFNGRSPRPPKDPINAMLSYGYTFLHRNIIGAIERHGLHPHFGFMHKMKRDHEALASDLVEDYRAFLVDRTVIDLVNSGKVSLNDFSRAKNNGIYLSKDLIRKLTNSLTNTLAEKIQFDAMYGNCCSYGFHAALDRKICSVIDAIDAGDASMYRPFFWVE